MYIMFVLQMQSTLIVNLVLLPFERYINAFVLLKQTPHAFTIDVIN